MKTRKLISALLMPAMFVACSDDVFEGMGLENNLATNEIVEDLTIVAGLEGNAESRGTFAEDYVKGVFGQFYFEPAFTSEGALVKTTNSTVAGDQVGLCLPSAASNGGVVTNVPFYIAGYQTTPDADNKVALQSLAKNDAFYDLQETDVTAFDNTKDEVNKTLIATAAAKLGAEDYELAKGATDIQKAVFKSVSGVMKGNYVLYYPYNDAFVEEGKIPAVELKSIQTQDEGTAHVVGNHLFAYSKTPFAVEGGKKPAKNMAMTPAAYFFQFRVYNTAAKALDNTIKLITVSTVDNAKAFGVKGYVTAGTTNTFAADAASAVDMIGLEVKNMTIPTVDATEDNYKEDAAVAYLSTYAIPSELAGKNIVINLYDTNGKVATITKAAAGSAIVEGGTDYWNLDLAGVEFKTADRLVYNETSLRSELDENKPGKLILKNNIKVEGEALTIPAGFTIDGANYTLELANSKENKVIGAATLDCGLKVANGTDLVVGNGYVGAAKATNASVTTITNYGKITIKNNATLNVTTLNNGGLVNQTASASDKAAVLNVDAKTPAKDDVNGKLVATTVNNNASAKNSDQKYTKNSGKISVYGSVENTTFANAGSLSFAADMSSTVTVNNTGTLNITENVTIASTIVNDYYMVIANKSVKALDATITNNHTITNDGQFTLSGATTFANNGTVSDNNVFSGLSRMTNGANAKFIRAIGAYNNLTVALSETKITGIKVLDEIEVPEKTSLNTNKTFYLHSDLSLPMAKGENHTIGNIEFNAVVSLAGVITTNSIAVKANGSILEGSNITVNGNISINEGKTLTANAGSYVICNDVTGKGSYSGPIYVK